MINLDFIVSLTPLLVRETVLVVAAAVRELQKTIKFWLFLKETNLHKSINDPDPITIIFSYSFDDKDKLVANVWLDSYFFNMLMSKSKLLFLKDFNTFSPKALNEFSPDITKFFLFNKFLVNLNFIFSIDLSMTISSIGRDILFLEKGLT